MIGSSAGPASISAKLAIYKNILLRTKCFQNKLLDFQILFESIVTTRNSIFAVSTRSCVQRRVLVLSDAGVLEAENVGEISDSLANGPGFAIVIIRQATVKLKVVFRASSILCVLQLCFLLPRWTCPCLYASFLLDHS